MPVELKELDNGEATIIQGRVTPHSPVRLTELSLLLERNSERQSMNKNNSVVAIYPSHTEAESAVKELHRMK